MSAAGKLLVRLDFLTDLLISADRHFFYQATRLHIPVELILKIKSTFILGTLILSSKYTTLKENTLPFSKVLFRSLELATYATGY